MPSILSKHRVLTATVSPFDDSPYIFDLNQQGPDISIADQMRRGYRAILEAFDLGYIGPDRPLLVVGGGIAGLMAAMTAVKNRVPTWIVEQKQLLSTQASCPSRYICPTQYDWPADHWQRGYYPYDNEPMPFSWGRGLAADVVKDLVEDEINKFLRDNAGLITVIASTFEGYTVVPHHSGRRWAKPLLTSPSVDPNFPSAFAMVVACTGFGIENTTAVRIKKCPTLTDDPGLTAVTHDPAPYTGHKFWELDVYEEDSPPLGLKSGHKPKVFISGSGDGALQDFLRIVSRVGSLGAESLSAGILYSQVVRPLKSSTQRYIESELSKVELEYRAEISSNAQILDPPVRKQHRCVTHAEAQAKHLLVINELSHDSKVWGRITQTLERFVKDLREDISIKVAHPCFHVTPFYGLNRFLTLLIKVYAAAKYPDVELFTQNAIVSNVVSISDLAGLVHKCESAESCHDKDHEIFYSSGTCMDVPPACVVDERKFEGGPYNVVIIRHGIHPKSHNLLTERFAIARN
jgi:hypothetical protein